MLAVSLLVGVAAIVAVYYSARTVDGGSAATSAASLFRNGARAFSLAERSTTSGRRR